MVDRISNTALQYIPEIRRGLNSQENVIFRRQPNLHGPVDFEVPAAPAAPATSSAPQVPQAHLEGRSFLKRSNSMMGYMDNLDGLRAAKRQCTHPVQRTPTEPPMRRSFTSFPNGPYQSNLELPPSFDMMQRSVNSQQVGGFASSQYRFPPLRPPPEITAQPVFQENIPGEFGEDIPHYLARIGPNEHAMPVSATNLRSLGLPTSPTAMAPFSMAPYASLEPLSRCPSMDSGASVVDDALPMTRDNSSFALNPMPGGPDMARIGSMSSQIQFPIDFGDPNDFTYIPSWDSNEAQQQGGVQRQKLVVTDNNATVFGPNDSLRNVDFYMPTIPKYIATEQAVRSPQRMTHSMSTSSMHSTASHQGQHENLAYYPHIQNNAQAFTQPDISASASSPVALKGSRKSGRNVQRLSSTGSVASAGTAVAANDLSSLNAPPAANNVASARSKPVQSSTKPKAKTKNRGYVRPKHPKVHCKLCSDNPDGFRGEHELQRHIKAKHKTFVKKWVIRDPREHGIVPEVDITCPLSECKQCASEKRYGAYYNAAAHLRRAHFREKAPLGRKPKNQPKESTNNPDNKEDDKNWPPMLQLKPWFFGVEVKVEANKEIAEEEFDSGDEEEPGVLPENSEDMVDNLHTGTTGDMPTLNVPRTTAYPLPDADLPVTLTQQEDYGNVIEAAGPGADPFSSPAGGQAGSHNTVSFRNYSPDDENSVEEPFQEPFQEPFPGSINPFQDEFLDIDTFPSIF